MTTVIGDCTALPLLVATAAAGNDEECLRRFDYYRRYSKSRQWKRVVSKSGSKNQINRQGIHGMCSFGLNWYPNVQKAQCRG
jgi:hypothetical protein